MIIDTLTSGLYLFLVNRDRELMTARMRGQKKAFWLSFGITLCIGIALRFFLL